VTVNLIVLVVTLLMAGFVAVWIFFPRLRPWMEAPKYRFLEQQRRFPDVLHEKAQRRGS
jgi:hypothetical protein